MTAAEPTLLDVVSTPDGAAVVFTDDGDRHRIRTEGATSLFVEAGAGTGKTHELVGRVVELVASGRLDDIKQLAAITFTEKAATELRDRIRRGLEAVAFVPRSADDEPAATGTGGEAAAALRARRCEDALDAIDDAPIGTLHGFALRILVEFPLEAGLPPGFEVRDPVAAAVDFDDRWTRFVDRVFAEPADEPLLTRAFALGMRLKDLRELAVQFHDHWDRLSVGRDQGARLFAVGSVEYIGGVDLTEVRVALADAIAHADVCSAADKYVAQVLPALRLLAERAEAVEELDAPEEDVELARIGLLMEDFPKLRFGNLGARKGEVPALRALVDHLVQVRDDQLERLRRQVLAPLLDRVARFTLDGAAERGVVGRLEFHDLLVRAVRLIEADAGVRSTLGQRWRVLLVDEFQDTDPLQLRLATLLALADPDVVPPTWDQSVCEPGRLFFVGDPKQSIYRFRRADIALYDRAKDTFPSGLVQLTRNFRTVPRVIAWINEAFASLFGDGVREEQPAYRALVPARTALVAATEPVVVLGGPVDGQRIGEIRDVEAAQLAAFVRDTVISGEVVRDRDGHERPARFDDVAVLLPTRTTLAQLERELDAVGVPYRIESRSLVFATDEIRDLLLILQAIDHPGDQVALVGALRSSAFGCSDRDLAEYSWAGGRWSAWARTPTEDDGLAPTNPVPEALAAIRDYHRLRHWVPVNELLERVIHDRGLVELTMVRRRPRDHWRRMRLLLDEARTYVAAGGTSVGGFVAWAEQQTEEGATRVETIVPEADDDAVRIMTVHAAKGLEFPITVVAGLNGDLRARSQAVLWDDDRPEVRLGLKGSYFETPGYAAMAAYEQGMDGRERQRLLYVAATRAGDKLVLSLHHKEGTVCHAASLWEVCERHPDLVALIPAPVVADATDGDEDDGPARVPAPAEVVASAELSATVRAWSDQRATLLAQMTAGGSVSPSQISGALERPDDERPDADDGGRPPGAERTANRRGRAGTAVGRAVHGTLQIVDLADPVDLDAVAVAQAQAEGVTDRAEAVARLARSAVESPAVRQAVAGGRYWRELFVAAPIGGRLVEGYIDLLYETADGEVVVVDYKTDQARSDAELDASMTHYRTQGAAYSAVVAAALDRRVARCVFVFARTTGAVEREIADLDAAVAEVEAILATG